jgi:hypothetical protein
MLETVLTDRHILDNIIRFLCNEDLCTFKCINKNLNKITNMIYELKYIYYVDSQAYGHRDLNNQ